MSSTRTMRRVGSGSRPMIAVGLVAALAIATPVSAAGSARTPSAAPEGTWGPVRAVGLSHDPSCGGLARTTTSSGTRLHGVTVKTGVDYARSSNDGASWGNHKRVSGTMSPVDLGRVAAADRHVYVVWQQRTTSPNRWVLYLRTNTDQGRAAAWTPRVRLTDLAGKVGLESVAASGASVYVATTRMRSDEVLLLTSRNHGRTWTKSTLGKAVRGPGLTGVAPVVSASGRTVVVSWVHTVSGQRVVRARVSSDGGRHFGAVRTLGAGDLPSVHALGGRVAVAAGTSARTAWLRTWKGGTWSPVRAVPDGSSLAKVAPQVVLRGTTQVGVALSPRTLSGPDEVSTLVWSESADGGVTWASPEPVSSPSIYYAIPCGQIWRSTGALYLMWQQYGGPVLRARL